MEEQRRQTLKSRETQLCERMRKILEKNSWHFAKSVCKQSEGDESRALICSSDEAFSYFSSSFETVSQEYEELPHWIKAVMPFLGDEEATIPFAMPPITPGFVKFFLRKRLSNSAPGDDKIIYHVLKHLPSCHHFWLPFFRKFYGCLIYLQEPGV